MSKCKTARCHAACCYNIPFEQNELVRYADRVVTPWLYTMPVGPATVPVTDRDPMKNRCPFLRADCRCNIYDVRPAICRKYGEIPELRCEYRK